MDIRRATDLTIAIPALAAAAVPMLFAIAALRATMDGPAIFRQTRYGLNGKPFTIYKLRTLNVVHDQDGREVHGAFYVPPIASFFRRTAINELPQLWNIIKGDMALIGPRPDIILHPELPGYEKRFAIKPGLTGLNQIARDKSFRNRDEELRRDLFYIAHRNLALDIKILFQTAKVVLVAKNIKEEPFRIIERPSSPSLLKKFAEFSRTWMQAKMSLNR